MPKGARVNPRTAAPLAPQRSFCAPDGSAGRTGDPSAHRFRRGRHGPSLDPYRPDAVRSIHRDKVANILSWILWSLWVTRLTWCSTSEAPSNLAFSEPPVPRFGSFLNLTYIFTSQASLKWGESPLVRSQHC